MENLAKRLGLRTEAQREAKRQERADYLKMLIRQSKQTADVLGKRVRCIDAEHIPSTDYQWTGSGLVFWAGKLIERI